MTKIALLKDRTDILAALQVKNFSSSVSILLEISHSPINPYFYRKVFEVPALVKMTAPVSDSGKFGQDLISTCVNLLNPLLSVKHIAEVQLINTFVPARYRSTCNLINGFVFSKSKHDYSTNRFVKGKPAAGT